jgi:membrane-anchored protein YejM (alkaline phosphatase superfamily)
MTNAHPLCPAVGWDGVSWTFYLGLPWIAILPISNSQIARVYRLLSHCRFLICCLVFFYRLLIAIKSYLILNSSH